MTVTYCIIGANGTFSILNYENNLKVLWTVHSECENIYIYTEQFSIESDYDWFHVDEERFSGYNLWEHYVVGNFTLVWFESDETNSDEGFIVHWQCVDTVPTTTVPTTGPTIGTSIENLIEKFKI